MASIRVLPKSKLSVDIVEHDVFLRVSNANTQIPQKVYTSYGIYLS